MKIYIGQEKAEVYDMIQDLLRLSRTTLHRFCVENELDYMNTRNKLLSPKIDIDWINELVSKINVKARFKREFSLSLMLNENVIFNHKTK